MKKIYSILLLAMFTISGLMSQNLVVNGNFEDDATGWTVVNPKSDGAAGIISPSFGVEDDAERPAFGSGKYMTWVINKNWAVQHLFQKVNLVVGKSYKYSGAIKDFSNPVFPANYKMDLSLTPVKYDTLHNDMTDGGNNGDNYTPPFLYKFSKGWGGNHEMDSVDGTWQADAFANLTYSESIYVVPDSLGVPGTVVEYYVNLNVGTAGGGNVLKFAIDEIVVEEVIIPIITNGSFDDATAWEIINLKDNGAAGLAVSTFGVADGNGPQFGDGNYFTWDFTGAWMHNVIYQKIELVVGKSYKLTGAIKSLADYTPPSGPNDGGCWAEYFLYPVEYDTLYEARDTIIPKFDAPWLYKLADGWGATDDFTTSLDTVWQDWHRTANIMNGLYTVSDTLGNIGDVIEFYVGVKVGNGIPGLKLAFDEFSVVKTEFIAEPIIKNGSFDDDSEWTVATMKDDLTGVFPHTFGVDDADGPTEGDGKYFVWETAGGWSNNVLYQEIVLQVGKSYKFSGAIKDLSATPYSTFYWAEAIIAPIAFDTINEGQGDYKAPWLHKFAQKEKWGWGDQPSLVGIDATWEGESHQTNYPDAIYTVLDSRGEIGEFIPYYIAIKVGSDADGLKIAFDEFVIEEVEFVSPDFDATLSDLTVDGSTVDGYDVAIKSYKVELAFGTTDIPLVAVVETNASANAVIAATDTLPGTTTIVVTAEDGGTERTYTVEFTIAPSDIATLSDLTVDDATVTGFDAATISYDVVLAEGTTDIPVVAATETDINASSVITQATELPGSATVVVTAEDGTTELTYTVNFTVTSGIADTKSDLAVTIYPNPVTNGKIHLSFGSVNNEVVSVSIMSITGKTVYSSTFSASSEYTIDGLDNFAKGIYLLNISTNNESKVYKIMF